MKPLIALWKETWWLWTGCALACGTMVYCISPFFFVLAPMLLVVFIYFAYMRFDGDGRPKQL